MNESDSYSSIDINQLLLHKLHQKQNNVVPDFDPHAMLVKRKQQIDNGEVPPISQIDADALYELQEFCQKHGIVGFNVGRMNPKAALKMLKARMGIKETPSPHITSNTLLLG